jgi:PGF-pre-PGF domain-containing protein
MHVKNTVPAVFLLVAIALFVATGDSAQAQEPIHHDELAGAMEALDPADAADHISAMTVADAGAVLGHMSPAVAAEVVEVMTESEAAQIVAAMDAKKAGTMLDEVTSDYLALMVDVMDESDLLRMLPEMTPMQLWGVPFAKLAERLPSVDAMHLAFWKRPAPPEDLPALQLTEQAGDLSVYNLPEVRGSEWAKVVGSPAPIDTIWAKFRRPTSDLRIAVNSLSGAPAGAPALPDSRVASAFFSVDIDVPDQSDVEVAAAIVFVDKTWLEANDVLKWSVQLARLNEALGVWEPIPTKRIREDEERVLFAVAIPGFSTLAITGSPTLTRPPVRVGTLALDRRISLPDEPVSVSALVTNESDEQVVYSAVLWVNASIETAESVVLAPGETAPVHFWVTRSLGTYGLRLDRSTASLSVRSDAEPASALVAPPSAGGFAPPVGLLAAAAGVAGGLIAAGGLTVLASSRRAVRRRYRSAAPKCH